MSVTEQAVVFFSCIAPYHIFYQRGVIFLKDFINLFLERGEGREKERGRNISVWLLLMHSLLGTQTATQACAPTGN